MSNDRTLPVPASLVPAPSPIDDASALHRAPRTPWLSPYVLLASACAAAVLVGSARWPGGAPHALPPTPDTEHPLVRFAMSVNDVPLGQGIEPPPLSCHGGPPNPLHAGPSVVDVVNVVDLDQPTGWGIEPGLPSCWGRGWRRVGRPWIWRPPPSVLRTAFEPPAAPLVYAYPRGRVERVAVRGRRALPAWVVRRVVRRHMTEVSYCAVRWMDEVRSPGSRVRLRLVISPEGRVARVDAVSGIVGATRTCVTNAFRRWTFPAAARVPTVARITLRVWWERREVSVGSLGVGMR